MKTYELPYRKVSAAKAVLRFLFCRKFFAEMAVEHDASLTLTKSSDLRNQFVGARLDEYKSEIRTNVVQRLPLVRRAFFVAGLTVTVSAVLGLVTGVFLKYQLGVLPAAINSALQMVGAGIVLWATIWQLDANAQTGSGETLLERTHWWLFRTLYVVGTIMFFVAYTWSV